MWHLVQLEHARAPSRLPCTPIGTRLWHCRYGQINGDSLLEVFVQASRHFFHFVRHLISQVRLFAWIICGKNRRLYTTQISTTILPRQYVNDLRFGIFCLLANARFLRRLDNHYLHYSELYNWLTSGLHIVSVMSGYIHFWQLFYVCISRSTNISY